MCLILFAIDPDPDCHLIVAANRDEQHARATSRADYWQDHSQILGGRDLVAGGTWLGVNNQGRFAAVTNFAEVPPDPLPPGSRGELTADFLSTDIQCEPYLASVQKKAQHYRGFNLLISDGSDVYYYSNRDDEVRKLGPGFYGLSNQLLDCDWPKVVAGTQEIESTVIETKETELFSELFTMLQFTGDDTPHSAKFILGDTYGTSVSTVVRKTGRRIQFEERGFNPTGDATEIRRFELETAR